MLGMALLLGLLKKGKGIDVDFDNEFIPAEKSDALYSYKNKRKWVRVARQWTLNIYTKNRWLHYWTIFNASYG